MGRDERVALGAPAREDVVRRVLDALALAAPAAGAQPAAAPPAAAPVSTREWARPGGAASLRYAMTVDAQDRLWFVGTGRQPNRLVGFDPAAERFFGVTPVASGGGTVRHMTFDPRSGAIWLGTDVGTVGRAVVGRAPRPIGE